MQKETHIEELQQVPASPQDACPLLNGIAIPQLSVTDEGGNSFDLTAAVRAKPSVLVFYRGGW